MTFRFWRRSRLVLLATALPFGALLLPPSACTSRSVAPLNVLLITADDLNFDSLGVFGSPVRGVTPHLDRLAAQGMRFEHAHVTVSVCEPSRAVWMTGRYPHRSGAVGFDDIAPGVPTLPETLRAAGYFTGLMGKVGHVVASRHASAFDRIVPADDLGRGRSPDHYREQAHQFFEAARQARRPFFLMANSHDPHRPFAGSAEEFVMYRRDVEPGAFPPTLEAYDPADVPVPGFLPELPEVRAELAAYHTSVHRLDATVGALLEALDEAGLAERTLVVFLSDHGMPFPFAKGNLWRHSTRTPLIVRWPGVAAPGAVDREHLLGGVDLAPTLLEAVGLPPLAGQDGRSFAPLLRGARQEGREYVFTQLNTVLARDSDEKFTMRAVEDRRFGYIWNGWSDGEDVMVTGTLSGQTFQAMQRAARDDDAIALRVEHYLQRVPEELYDYESDPDALHNRIHDPELREVADRLRARLLAQLEESADPKLERYRAFLTR